MFTFSQDCWKPRAEYHDAEHLEIPYKPFLRTEKLGRVADISSAHPPSKSKESRTGEGAFFAVDIKTTQKKPARRTAPSTRKTQVQQPQRREQRYTGRRRYVKPDRTISAVLRSLAVDPDVSWELLQEYSLTNLGKTNLPESVKIESTNVGDYGSLRIYDKSFDTVTSRTKRSLVGDSIAPPNPTASKDPVFAEMAASGKANVFATSDVLTSLMTAPRSVISFDVAVVKKNGCYWLDKRSDAIMFEGVSIDENSTTAPFKDKGPDSPLELFKEVNSVCNLVRDELLVSVPDSVPDLESPPSELSIPDNVSYGFRYKIFELPSGFRLALRLPLNGLLQGSDGSLEHLYVRTLYEWFEQSGLNGWKHRVDKKKGAILAEELHANTTQMGKWALEGILADISMVQLAFVSRVADTAPDLLSTMYGTNKGILQQLNLSLSNCWANVMVLLDEISRQSDGIYCVLRPYGKSVLRLYSAANVASIEDLFMSHSFITDEEEDQEQ
ncbi:hypothetical protein P9112_009808 [Eukaryota sp. TZLM1-RC]